MASLIASKVLVLQLHLIDLVDRVPFVGSG